MAVDEFLFSALKSWFVESERLLASHGLTASRGLTASLESSPPRRDKKSMSLALDGRERLGQFILWATGEAEMETVEVASGRARREHRDLRSTDDLRHALEILLIWPGVSG